MDRASPARPPRFGWGSVPPLPPGRSRLHLLAPPGGPVRGPLASRALERVRRATGWYVGAAIAAAVTGAVLLVVIGGQELDPVRIATLAVVFAWPAVPTVVVVAALGARATVAVVGGYAVLLVAPVAVFGHGDPLERAASAPLVWAFFALPASVILAAVAARPVRAVGAFLAPGVFVAGVGLLTWGWVELLVFGAGASGAVARLLAVVTVVVAVALALLTVPVAARRHRRKAASDQSILVDQWWLLFFLTQCLMMSVYGWVAAAMLLPYVTYRAVLTIGRTAAARRAATDRPVRLLLLRVFGSRGRSEALLRDVGAYWRHVGSVEMIAGPDLVSENLEPHEFLDFAAGRLARQFVTGPDDLQARLRRLDLMPDADGRFRVTEFLCHDDTWRPVLDALVRTVDVILIDLRGLDPGRRGVVHEIHQLAALGLLDRVVALVDGSTHLPFLHHTLDQAGAALLRAVPVQGGRTATVELLDHLAAAATGTVRTRSG
jgi:hypothetical protein